MRLHLILQSIFLFTFFTIKGQDIDSNRYKDHYYLIEAKAPFSISGRIAAEYTFTNPGNINKKRKPLILLGLGKRYNESSGYGVLGLGFLNPRPNKKAMISTNISHSFSLKPDQYNFWIIDIVFRYVKESGFFYQFSPGLFLGTYDFGEILYYPLPIVSAGVGFTFRRFSQSGRE